MKTEKDSNERLARRISELEQQVQLLQGELQNSRESENNLHQKADHTSAPQDCLPLQQRLQDEGSLLNALLQQIPEGIVLAEAPSGKVIFTNNQVSDLLGRGITPSSKVEDYNLDQVCHADGHRYRPEELPLARSLRTGEVVRGEEVRFQRADGATRVLSVRSAPVYDDAGCMIAAVSIFNDISERKQAEETLHKNENFYRELNQTIEVERGKLRAAFDHLPVGVGFTDMQGNTLSMDAAALAMHGFSTEEEMFAEFDQYVQDFELRYSNGSIMPPEDWPMSRAMRDEYVVDFELVLKRKSTGQERLLSYTAAPVKDSAGRETMIVYVIQDLTERQRANNALRRSEERFSTAFRVSPDAMILSYMDDGLIIEVNESFERLFGYKREDALGKTTLGLNLYMDPADRKEMVERVREQGTLRDFEIEVRASSGELHYVRVSAEKMEANQEVHLLAVFHDETQRKLAEQALRESEEHFRSMADNISQLAWMADETGSIFWYNQRWFDYTGASFEEMRGWGWEKVHHPDHVERVVEKFSHCIATGETWEDTFPLRGKDGQYRWFLSRAMPIRDENGRLKCWFGTNTDITEQLEVEKALRESQERFEVALRNSPILVFSVDCDLRYTWLYRSNAGISAGDVIGKREDELAPLENVRELVDFKRRVIETGQGSHQEIHMRSEGKERTYDITAEPLREADGTVVGLTAAAIEITDLLRMKTEMIRREEQVEIQRLINQSQEVERTRIARELHDGPLQELIYASFLVQDIESEEDAARRGEKLGQLSSWLQDQAASLRAFTSELRPPALAPFGLEKAIQSHMRQVEMRFPGIKLYRDLMPDRQAIPEDTRLALYRIYQEGMNNILKHANASEVSVRFQFDQQQAEIVLSDNGSGFDVPKNWVRLARKGHLGLVGMRERVESIGGSLLVQSALGAGTTVRVTAPLAVNGNRNGRSAQGAETGEQPLGAEKMD